MCLNNCGCDSCAGEHQRLEFLTRRHFLKSCPLGLAGIYLVTQMPSPLWGGGQSRSPLFGDDELKSSLRVRQPHFRARTRNVIYIHLAGSPPGLDLFDYKPELNRRDGEDCPDEFLKGRTFAFTQGVPKLLGSPRKFSQHGQSGTWLSDALQNLPRVVDKLCIVKSMFTDQFNHAPAQLLLLTGSPRQGRPSMGAWVTYGLGSENQDLPGFVVLNSGGSQPSAGKNAWGSGFLPSVFQGVQCRSQGDPVLYVGNPKGMSRQLRRTTLDAINRLNEIQAQELGDPETRTRIAQYELAYRMQISVPEVMDISRESEQTLADYGAKPGELRFSNNCLLARRLVEQGVRFVQLFDWGWDFHGTDEDSGLGLGLTKKAAELDRPVTALIDDLERRGLLQETLVIIGGEFGRTPFREGRTAASPILGRDHYPNCYTILMAGGGIRPGTYGSTDELGFSVAENPVHVHDFQATVLYLLGMEHTRLTYRYQGRDFRLTDVHGEVIHDLIG